MFDQPALEKAVLVPCGEQPEEKVYRGFSSSIIGLLEVTETLLLVGFQTSVCFLWPTVVRLEELKQTKAKWGPGHVTVITTVEYS